EWRRLKIDPYHQIEFIVTMHFLRKYLPKKGLVLDAGGGPGRYTIELAKQGYDIVLLDIVPEMLKIAKRQIKKARVQDRVKQFVEGSVISRIGLLKSILIEFPHEMQYAKHHWEIGDYVPGLQGKGFTATHWFLPEELHDLFERQGTEILEMAGLEGLSSHHEKETNRLYKDKEKWNIWIEILLKTCTHPSVIGSSEHFLLVCRKSG
ncbi:MAG: class I SAM-dependent methyltransferase, partial [Candidatus Bathyarchaeales archaeon]